MIDSFQHILQLVRNFVHLSIKPIPLYLEILGWISHIKFKIQPECSYFMRKPFTKQYLRLSGNGLTFNHYDNL